MRISVRRRALLSALLLTGCATQPLPFTIEKGGTLPSDRYAALDRLAENAAPVIKIREGQPANRPEPFWVYSVDPGLDLAHLPLQIGPFKGGPGKAGEVAAALPKRLADELGRTHLFASVATTAVSDALVLSGVVTRANTEDADGLNGSLNTAAMTQVEARLTRNGMVVGVMQVNAYQLDSSAFAALAIAVYSLIQGSRVSYVSAQFRQMFEGIAAGRAEGIDTGTFSRRFIRAPLASTPSPFSE